MDRRQFSASLLATISSVALIDTVVRGRLLAAPARITIERWLAELHTMCGDVRRDALSPAEWRTQIAALHDRLPVEDLARMIDFDRAAAEFTYPDLGVVTHDPVLPKIAGVPARYSFISRIFGMAKGRAIIPHGHRNMVSSHRVLGGELHLRQYDRLADDGDHLIIRPTRDEAARLGSVSSISPTHDNIHWLIATTPRAFTFDVIVVDLAGRATEVDNLDIATATRVDGDRLRVAKLDVDAALAKYGKTA